MNKIRVRLNKLEVTALIAGFVLMVFELAGARILAPGIGSSTYVWTSVIGVIIAALSLGYWVGGKVADTRGYAIDIARLALLAGVTITLTTLQYQGVINWVATTFEDPRLQGVVASLILFAPTSFILGTISPYLAKLNVRSLRATGRSVASLSALNSIGGIVGTFIAGFVLFSYIGSRETLVLTALFMVAVSWLSVPKADFKIRVFISLGIIATLMIPTPATRAISIDTPSANYTVFEDNGMRLLATGPYAAQSGIVIKHPETLAFWYTQQLASVVSAAEQRGNILILGGGALSLPQYLADKYPDSTIDVVEIDPELATIARKHFGYKDPSNVNLIFNDARTYVNQTNKQYDIVIVDVYSDAHVPFTFLTKEYGDKLSHLVTPQGIVAVNMIAGMKGGCGELLQALDAPYRAHFTSRIFRVQRPDEPRSNLVAVYSNQPFAWPASSKLELPSNLSYTDDFAPAERLQHDCPRG